MSENLKPCPFCGGEAKLDGFQSNFFPFDYKYRVTCGKCYTMSNLFKSESDALNAWNRRADHE